MNLDGFIIWCEEQKAMSDKFEDDPILISDRLSLGIFRNFAMAVQGSLNDLRRELTVKHEP